jgi:hypothetical protein
MEKLCGIGNMQKISSLRTKVKLLEEEILYSKVHYKNNGDNDNNQTTNLSNILGKHKIKELQKTAILGPTHIFQKVLTWRYKILNMGSNITHSINCYYRIAATIYTLKTWYNNNNNNNNHNNNHHHHHHDNYDHKNNNNALYLSFQCKILGYIWPKIIRITQGSRLLGPRLPNDHRTYYFYVQAMHLYCLLFTKNECRISMF